MYSCITLCTCQHFDHCHVLWWALFGIPTYLHVDDPVPTETYSMAAQAAVHGGVHGEDPLVATRTEQVKCCQSLVCLLQSLTSTRTTIELRNEITVEGIVTSVDLHMKYIKLIRHRDFHLFCMHGCLLNII